MSRLQVVSPGPGEGKTAVSAGLLRLLGVRSYERAGGPDHPDARFVREQVGAGGLAEGEPGLFEGEGAGPEDWPTLAVVAYRGAETALAGRGVGRDLVGVVLNAVPAPQERLARREIVPALEAGGAPVLGLVPEERRLRAATVGELARFLDGEVLTAPEALDNMVEHYMVGAMSHVSGLPYFNRKPAKAVVCGGNRLDVHMAALGTPCQALVLTGGYDPDPVVLERAEADGVPIVKVLPDSVATMDRISLFLRGVRFRQAAKVEPFAELLRRHVDLAPVARALGLKGTAVGVG